MKRLQVSTRPLYVYMKKKEESNLGKQGGQGNSLTSPFLSSISTGCPLALFSSDRGSIDSPQVPQQHYDCMT